MLQAIVQFNHLAHSLISPKYRSDVSDAVEASKRHVQRLTDTPDYVYPTESFQVGEDVTILANIDDDIIATFLYVSPRYPGMMVYVTSEGESFFFMNQAAVTSVHRDAMLSHELGHIHLDHLMETAKAAKDGEVKLVLTVKNETEADAYAAKLVGKKRALAWLRSMVAEPADYAVKLYMLYRLVKLYLCKI